MRQQENYNELHAFLLVAQESSFTKAAIKLGISQSALSRSIKLLEQRLGLQLFTRTTRSLSLTHAGEALFVTAEQSFGSLDNKLDELKHLRETPAGLVRISASQYAIDKVLLPKLAKFKQLYPDIELELISDTALSDIISTQFDAGVRFGSLVTDGMISVRIDYDEEIAVVGSPDYFHEFGFPKTPVDLNDHNCLGYRFMNGGMYHWDFVIDGQPYKLKTQGQWVFSTDYSVIDAAKRGLGIGYVPIDMVKEELKSGQLIHVLREFSHTFSGFHLYYPHHNVSPALRAVIDALRVK